MTRSGHGIAVLNIGTGIGALVIRTPGCMHGHDIEISPVEDPALRTQATVRARYVRGGVNYTVVVDCLREGRYTIWRDPVTPLAEIDVRGDRVAEFTWPVTALAA
ncbi:phospholipase [Actinoplanes sp. NPDC000266]